MNAKVVYTREDAPSPVDLQFKNLPLCFEHKVVSNFRIEQPPKCSQITSEATSGFQATIFSPPPTHHNVEVWSCSLKKYITTYKWFFFGGSDIITWPTTSHAIPHWACEVWARKRVVSAFGPLRREFDESDTLTTANMPIPKWVYLGEANYTTTNAALTKTYISFNAINGNAIHPWDHLIKCHTLDGYCIGREAVYIFPKFSTKCLGTNKKVATNTTIIHHNTQANEFFQAPDVDLAFRSLMKCPKRVEECYADRLKHVRCTLTHYVVASSDDNAVPLNTKQFSEKISQPRSSDHQTLAISQSLTSISLLLDHEIRQLRDEQIRLQCKNSRVMLTNLKSTQYVQPSAALSILLNREAFATMGAEVLQEIACVRVRATMLPTLWVGGRMASRPILELRYQNRTRTAQYTTGGYIRWGLRNFMPPNSGFMIYKIQHRNFVFKNGSLLDDGLPKIIELGLPTAELELPQQPRDPAYLVNLLEDEPPIFGLEALHSSLAALRETSKESFKTFGLKEDQIDDFHNRASSQVQQESFLASIAQVIRPIEPWWRQVFRYAGYVWSAISTIILCVIIFNSIKKVIKCTGTVVQQP